MAKMFGRLRRPKKDLRPSIHCRRCGHDRRAMEPCNMFNDGPGRIGLPAI
jgi:hypothetical protein